MYEGVRFLQLGDVGNFVVTKFDLIVVQLMHLLSISGHFLLAQLPVINLFYSSSFTAFVHHKLNYVGMARL
jgi:hypothetical protein